MSPEDRTRLEGTATAAAAAAAGLATALLFLASLPGDFLDWDDLAYIPLNQGLGAGLGPFLRTAFLQFTGDFWLPLLWVSYGIDHAIWGLDPAGYHLTNALLHGWNAAVVALLASELVSPSKERRAGVALLAGLLWGIHPLRVESVAWIAERKDVLCGAFGFPALLLWIRFARSRGGETGLRSAWADRRYRLAVALLAASLLSKPSFVVAPMLFLLGDLWLGRARSGASLRGLLAEKAPFLALGLACSVVTAIAQRPALMPLAEASFAARILHAGRSTLDYLGFVAWPRDLMPWYPHPMNAATFTDLRFAVPLVLVLAATAASCAVLRRGWTAPTLWLGWLVSLAPVLGIVQVGGQGMADRFTYLPSLFPTLGAVGLFVHARNVVVARTGIPGSDLLLRTLATAAVLALGATTFALMPTFWSSENLWTRVIETSREPLGKARYFRARARLHDGKTEGALADVEECLAISRRKRYRRTFEVLALRGDVLLAAGRPDAALASLDEALVSGPPGDPFLVRARARALREREAAPRPGLYRNPPAGGRRR
jgi:hypothetical protein